MAGGSEQVSIIKSAHVRNRHNSMARQQHRRRQQPSEPWRRLPLLLRWLVIPMASSLAFAVHMPPGQSGASRSSSSRIGGIVGAAAASSSSPYPLARGAAALPGAFLRLPRAAGRVKPLQARGGGEGSGSEVRVQCVCS